MTVRAAAVLLAVVVVLAGCGSTKPKERPGAFAVRVVGLVVHNKYSRAWRDLHPADQKVAPRDEYVACETRSPVIAVPRSVKVVRVRDESIGLGDGTFVPSKAVAVRMGFAGGFTLVHTVHVVESHGSWKWILPSWRFRDYRADRCPSTAPATAPTPYES